MTDQVSPLGSLGTGSSVLPLPSARPAAAQDTTSQASAQSSNAKPVADSGGGNAAQSKAASVTSAKAANLDPQAINAQLQQANSSLQFKVDKSTGISYFKIIDANTGKVIRQVPSADVLAMAQKLQDFSGHQNPSGILVDQKG